MTHLRFLLLLLLCASMTACAVRGGRGGGGSSNDDDAANDDDATSNDDDATGDDDDATGDDDDDDDDDDGASNSDQEDGSLPCDEEVVDIWTFTTGTESFVTVSVDTVSAASTFDPGAYAVDGFDPNTDDLLGSGDDDFDCTFPPPTYSCPEFDFVAPGSGTIAIVVENYGCEDESGLAEYTLRVESTGSISPLTLLSDDEELGGSPAE